MARLIDGALQSAERARVLVSRLLGFARRQALVTRPVDSGVAAGGHARPDHELDRVDHRAQGRCPRRLPPALADANQLELAILNLCVNSRDAMPNGGVLTIAAEPAVIGPGGMSNLNPGAYVRLSVIDTGGGMDEETLAKAIEPFFSTKELGKGTGLGLSMVHGLAAQLGGALRDDEHARERHARRSYLPVANAAAQSLKRAALVPLRPLRPLEVLLIDDEELVREGTAEMLRDLGHTGLEAQGGAEALASSPAASKLTQ